MWNPVGGNTPEDGTVVPSAQEVLEIMKRVYTDLILRVHVCNNISLPIHTWILIDTVNACLSILKILDVMKTLIYQTWIHYKYKFNVAKNMTSIISNCVLTYISIISWQITTTAITCRRHTLEQNIGRAVVKWRDIPSVTRLTVQRDWVSSESARTRDPGRCPAAV